MGRTLFRYLFKDLVRIFLLSAVVIAGIMSFGGLLRPLTRYGLDVFQVGEIWLYLMPAMTAYSLPIAAVFATSMVYGRLSADNELTACRAAGIGYGAICGPAVALGLTSAILSLLFLSFVVPFFSYKAEKVIYANVAHLIASEIQRTHEFSPSKDAPSIFAKQAYIPPDSGKKGEQIVVLEQPTVVSRGRDPEDRSLRVPRLFYLAREATLHIQQGEAGDAEIRVVLKGATWFPRVLGSRPQGGLGDQEVGPIAVPSRLQQNVKFMDIRRLRKLATQPEGTSRVRNALRGFVESEQKRVLLAEIARAAVSRSQGYVVDTPEQYQLIAQGAKVQTRDDVTTLTAGPQPIRLMLRRTGGRAIRMFECKSLSMSAEIYNESDSAIVAFDMKGVALLDADGRVEKMTDRQVCTIPLPESIRQLQTRKVSDYLREDMPTDKDLRALKRETMVASNEVLAEMHARASFGISCLVLVMVGAVLGMQFRSGDFLTAFSVSVIPAIVAITLVVAGTQTAGNVSVKTLHDPIWLGVTLIWLGNALAGVLALWLYNRIRQT